MSQFVINMLFVGASFALYIGIAIWARAGTTAEFYAANRGVNPVLNGMATAADWMSAASFIGTAGVLYLQGFDGLAYILGWTGGYMLVAILLAPYLRKFGQYTVPDFLGARFGDVTLAANQILMQFLEITAYALDGFALAAETLVGQAVGARVAADAHRAARLSMGWGLAGGVALGAAFGLGGPWIIDLMATAPDVRAEARAFLPWMLIAPSVTMLITLLALNFLGDGLRDALDPKER